MDATSTMITIIDKGIWRLEEVWIAPEYPILYSYTLVDAGLGIVGYLTKLGQGIIFFYRSGKVLQHIAGTHWNIIYEAEKPFDVYKILGSLDTIYMESLL